MSFSRGSSGFPRPQPESKEIVHVTLYRVPYADTDAAGVVYYGNYLRLFEIGRTEFLRDRVGISYKEIESRGIIMPVVEAYIRYKAPAFYDDLLSIETVVSRLDSHSITFFCQIRRHDEEGLIVQGSTRLTTVEKKTGRLIRIPEEVGTSIAPFVIQVS